ncbi:hypothetical protein PAECIP111893_05233 [Paenibacillus plantiphilus]|uniref:DUF4830 domain-containing protein n=1 Tax=Paenibacillus plantiphilus TaxID=2905650 RepID=A0ABM9CX18_9BACL|nr:hypothetical protein [Paenibacillus plantiphilus]CAH1225201.1 hypothetical protein PAECIP111893_05233 [Paenibacillus plantiphilus]
MKLQVQLFVLSVLILLTGCLADTATSIQVDDKTLAKQYVKEKYGYTIIADKEPVRTFIMDKKLLNETQYQQLWSVQEKEPDAFIGKEIATYTFTVDNHPLEKQYGLDINVCVMVVEGEAIGGYSFPDTDELLFGGVNPIDGREFEEVKGLTFLEWREQWKKKYGK